MKLAGKYKSMRSNKGASILLLLDIQKIKLLCNENQMLIKNFLHPKHPTEPPEEAASAAPHSALTYQSLSRVMKHQYHHTLYTLSVRLLCRS